MRPAIGASPAPAELPRDTFAFGRNWERYLAESLDPERERRARESLEELVDTELSGKRFLDIGCGSGLFSLSAHKLGASTVVSIDVDRDSVACCERLRESAGNPGSWSVLHGSILDDALVGDLEPADVVYSWGVLHHTGDLWRALPMAASLVRPGGRFCIAIYNAKPGGLMSSARWQQVKRRYNRISAPVRAAMRLAHRGYWQLHRVRKGLRLRRSGRGATALARAKVPPRGMARATDLEDWLGGYPYEYAPRIRSCASASRPAAWSRSGWIGSSRIRSVTTSSSSPAPPAVDAGIGR